MRKLFSYKQTKVTKVLKLPVLGFFLLGVCAIAGYYILGDSDIQQQLPLSGIVQDGNPQTVQQSFLFLENRGQWHKHARFVARQPGMTAWFENDAILLQLEKQEDEERMKGVVTRLKFKNASEVVQLQGQNRHKAKQNYLIGNDRHKWQRNVATYDQILYSGLYDGVDLRVRNNNGVLEYDLLLQPMADLEQIMVECEGIRRLKLEDDGSLLIETAIGPVRQKMPKTWNVLANGEKLPVLCRYRLIDETHFGFVAENRQPELALVIDPGLEWSTFLGGTNRDRMRYASNLVIADNGDILITGRTNSIDFPVTIGAYDTSSAGDYDVFVSRLDPDQSGVDQLLWSTFLGGTGLDYGIGIELDESGNIIVVGLTGSVDFPTTIGAYDTSYNGGNEDAFIVQLDASGSGLLYSTFVGGSGSDRFQDFAIVPDNNLMILGSTSSWDFPVSLNAFDSTYNGEQDVVVMQLDLDQIGEDQLIWSTFLGGSSYEQAMALGIDASENVIVTGNTDSRNFPTTSGAFSTNHNGGSFDIFIARLDPLQTGNDQLINATFFGGVGYEEVSTLAVDSFGMVTISGSTKSENFPVTAGAYDKYLDSISDSFISRFDFSLNNQDQLVYSTFIGGGWVDNGYSLVVNDSGKVYLTGTTGSSGFPTTPNAYDHSYNGSTDGFALLLNPNKSGAAQLEYSSYLGGSSSDYLWALALDSSGNMIIAGSTRSSDFPTTQNAYQQTFGGGTDDVFLARIAIGPVIPFAKMLFAKLDGDQVPVLTSGAGNGVFELNEDSTSLYYEITIRNLTGSITAAHFHIAPPDSNGPVVKTIFTDGVISGDTTFSGTWTSADVEPLNATLLEALYADEIYVNVHSDSFPDGEIRGQIVSDTLAAMANALPDVIYGTLGNKAGENTGSLIRIDPVTGAGNLIGPTGITSSYGNGVPAVAVTSTGKIFATDLDWSALYRLDAMSGAAIFIGETGLSTPDAIACDMNDVLYFKLFDGRFHIIDKQTGAETWIGNINAYIRSMAFDPTDNTLWASAGGGGWLGNLAPLDAIYTIDITTCEVTLVGTTGFGGAIPGLVFDENGNLFGVVGGGKRPNDLIAIDKTTGAGTVVGPVGFPAVAGLARRMPIPLGPQISIDARAINIGNAKVGTSVSRTVTITNYGSEDLTVDAIAEPGTPFSIADLPDLPAVIPKRGSETFRVTFSPNSRGLAQTTLAITSNDSNDPILEKEIFGRGVNFDSLGLVKPGIAYASTGLEKGGSLLTIDLETGAGTLIGPNGLPNIPGLAISWQDELFASTGWVVDANLYRLDAANGAELSVGSMGIPLYGIEALAFDPNNILYGVKWTGYENSSGMLIQINTETGATNDILNIPEGVAGMAFDPMDSTLWISSVQSDVILTVDISAGEVTEVGLTGLGGSTPDIFFDPFGNLYGIKAGSETDTSDWLISIDKTTGMGALIGEIGFTDVSGAAASHDSAVVSGIDDKFTSLPKAFSLGQNYPNPFNPSTTIRYDLPKAVHVKLAIYDILGRRVRTLVDRDQLAGSRKTIWNGRNDAGNQVATGVYLYRIKAGNFSKTRKLVLIR